MTTLPEPSFIALDPAADEARVVADYEERADKQLYPAQPEKLLLAAIAYEMSLLRIGVNEAAKQNLVAYAVGANLDHLGELVLTPRLPAVGASTRVEFTKTPGALAQSVVIDSGTLITGPENIRFTTDSDLTILPGQTSGIVKVTAIAVGTGGNGIAAGRLNRLVTPITNIASIASLDVTSAGAAEEQDDPYRERIKLAPNQFSVAGSEDAYRYYALSQSQAIIDVALSKLRRVEVDVYLLTNEGPPTADLIEDVGLALSGDRVRPLTDIVRVLAPTAITYSIRANVTLFAGVDASTLEESLRAIAASYADEKSLKLGQDIVRSQLIAALGVAGVYDVELTEPAADIPVSRGEWATAGVIDITIAGFSEG